MFNQKTNNKNGAYAEFDALKLTLASKDDVLDWSYGEVSKAETINYRTFKSEPDGLFCEKIFGPSKNYECYCGKYKKIRYKGIICDKCGVEVTTKDVRRERMGHIKLAIPVTHVWYAYGIPNKLAIILDIPQKKLLSVIYYTRYMVMTLEEDLRKDALKKAEESRAKEMSDLNNELEQSLKEDEKNYKEALKLLKEDKKNAKGIEFKSSKLDHKFKQDQAKIRKEFVEKEEELDELHSKLIQLLSKSVIGSIISEDEYLDLEDRDLLFFEAKMGAEAVVKLLEDLDLPNEINVLKALIRKSKGDKKAKAIRRLQYLEGFVKNNTSPTWMVMEVVPVIPPELRPIISLPGGKFATSDLNDLYRRIINRNNRLKRLIEIGAPDVILRNEKRMLQESVDALIDNSHRPSKPMMNNKRLPYQSLTDELRGKKGIFRRNLLGKRVDYSGRAVIIGDATLTFDQCGLPKSVALEMYKPFVIHNLIENEIAPNVRLAKEMVESEEEVIWDILEKVIANRPVLLNRAPTLHKYSIQAFYPRLVEGEAIRIHPLVCKAYNADFDGDQMSVHLLLTDEAIEEAEKFMMSSKNTVNISNGKVLANPAKDMLLGFYLLTDYVEVKKPKMFGSASEAIKSYQRTDITANEKIVVKYKGAVQDTSVGRIIFNEALPEDYKFVNERIWSGLLSTVIDEIKDKYDAEVVIELLDELKTMGFKYATDLAFSFAMEDCNVEMDVQSQIEATENKDLQLQENYLQGLITEDEKDNLSIKMWNDIADDLAEKSWETLDKNNAVYEMVESGANGGKIQARQVLTIKGMVRDSSGNWVPLPIKGNYRDGLNALEYFVAANGARKGVADTALRTSSSGYLTRKLVDVAHEVIIRTTDCGYDGEGIALKPTDDRRLSFVDRIAGRVLAAPVKINGKKVASKGDTVSLELAERIEKAGLEEVRMRSPFLCEAPLGLCKKCYGISLESGKEVAMGKAVGVIAAQSIGEPGTQMTLRTFHTGGVAKVDITQGLPRIEELFEARSPKAEADIVSISGKVIVEIAEDESATVFVKGKKSMARSYIVDSAKKISVTDGSKVKEGQTIFIDAEEQEKQAPFDANVKLEGGILELNGEISAEETINIHSDQTLIISDGDEVKAGQAITDGSVDPKKLAEIAGIVQAQKYVLDEVQRVFNEQGVPIADVHIEIIIRQMARLGRVMASGGSQYLVGSLINRFAAKLKNEMLLEEGKDKALVMTTLIGIKASSLYTESFLSAMSFQEQVKVLTNSAILGKTDYLRGMKENVMVGRSVPAGDSAEIKDFKMLEELNN